MIRNGLLDPKVCSCIILVGIAKPSSCIKEPLRAAEGCFPHPLAKKGYYQSCSLLQNIGVSCSFQYQFLWPEVRLRIFSCVKMWYYRNDQEFKAQKRRKGKEIKVLWGAKCSPLGTKLQVPAVPLPSRTAWEAEANNDGEREATCLGFPWGQGARWNSPQCKHADVQRILPDKVQVKYCTCSSKWKKIRVSCFLITMFVCTGFG